jgi:hypothetical protein
MEAAANNHIEASGWMRDHLTEAIGLHVADEVWETIDRHLFPDTSGRRHGAPRIGSWWDFTRIPGRARSHTKARPVWETWRLVGTLNGHLDAYRHPDLSTSVSTAIAAADQPAGTSILAQPARLPAPTKPTCSWWEHDGELAVVFSGLPGGDVVLPVRLPQGAGQWAHLAHFLADPSVWHKIDLVRVRHRHAPGGWRYYAHLLTHQPGDYELARALRAPLACQQEDRAQSTGTSPQRDHRAGSARAGSHHLVASAEQAIHHSAHPRTDQHRWTSRDQPNIKPHNRIRWKHDQRQVN